MLRRTEEEITHLGIDEKSSEKGHTYASILTDIDRSRVLDLVPERKLEAAVDLLETLTSAQRASVKALAMDMWPAYMSATRQCMPLADIVHDKFHVSKYLGETVDAVRKQEHRSLSQAGTSPLTGSKWAWLKKSRRSQYRSYFVSGSEPAQPEDEPGLVHQGELLPVLEL